MPHHYHYLYGYRNIERLQRRNAQFNLYRYHYNLPVAYYRQYNDLRRWHFYTF